jgi:hypothetical protein
VKLALVVLCSMTVAGCYRYVAKDVTSLAPNTEVSVDLSASGMNNVKPAIGDGVTGVNGRVTEVNGTRFTLALTTVRRRFDGASNWNGETLQLATTDFDRIREKQLARGRTTAAAVGLGAVGVGLLFVIAKATGLVYSSGGGKPIPPP